MDKLNYDRTSITNDKQGYADSEIARIDKLLASKYLGDSMRENLLQFKAKILKDKIAHAEYQISWLPKDEDGN